MSKFCRFFFWLFIPAFGFWLGTFGETASAQTASAEITVDANVIKHGDFAQMFGGYLPDKPNLSPGSSVDYTNQAMINAVKQTLPQDPDHPVVVRTKSGTVFDPKKDPPMTNAQTKAVIRFCKQVNCDPMFVPLGESWNSTPDEIRAKIRMVRDECRTVFGDDKHCLHWDIGNEPPTNGCVGFADFLHATGLLVREVLPNAIIHSLELFDTEAKTRDTNEMIGKCILRELSQKTPALKIDVLKTHWYPYKGEYDVLRRSYTDGNKLLTWGGIYARNQSMTYPNTIYSIMSGWPRELGLEGSYMVGIGEMNPSDKINYYATLPDQDIQNDILAGCCWLGVGLETDGTCADCNPCNYVSNPGSLPTCCSKKCVIPPSYQTKTLNGTWGSAFWHMDELGILAEAGMSYVQRHGLLDNGFVFGIVSYQGVRSPASYGYGFLANYFGNTIVQGSSNNPSVLNSHASVDEDGNLRVLLINKDTGGASKTAHIRLSNYNADSVGEAYVLKIPNNGNFNSSTSTGTTVETRTNISVGQDMSFEVGGYTAVIIKIPKAGGDTGHQFNAGWNDLVWDSGWPQNISFASLPSACTKVSLLEGEWFDSFIKDYKFDGVFASGSQYKIWCSSSARWSVIP